MRRYAAALSESINGRLAEIKESGKIAEYPSNRLPTECGESSVIAELFLDGFYDEKPSRLEIRFSHDGQKLLEPKIIEEPLELGNMIVLGSSKIRGFGILLRAPMGSLSAAVESARAYINSCSDPESIAIDPEVCAKIGGHIHAATITQHAGFQWVIPPTPEQA